MKGFRRGAFLVSSSSAIQDGLEAFVLSYLKVLFHVDMIKFYSMLRFVEGHEGDVEDLFAAMGELDALIAAASLPGIPALLRGSRALGGGTGGGQPHIS